MTIACPLCTNTNEIISQPSSINWQQTSCSSCEANLVLIRESSSGTLQRPLRSSVRLQLVSSETRRSAVFVRSRLFMAVIAVLGFGVLGYLYFMTGLFSNDEIATKSPTSPTTGQTVLGPLK